MCKPYGPGAGQSRNEACETVLHPCNVQGVHAKGKKVIMKNKKNHPTPVISVLPRFYFLWKTSGARYAWAASFLEIRARGRSRAKDYGKARVLFYDCCITYRAISSVIIYFYCVLPTEVSMARNRFRASYSRTGCYFQKKKTNVYQRSSVLIFRVTFPLTRKNETIRAMICFFFFYCNPVKKKS